MLYFDKYCTEPLRSAFIDLKMRIAEFNAGLRRELVTKNRAVQRLIDRLRVRLAKESTVLTRYERDTEALKLLRTKKDEFLKVGKAIAKAQKRLRRLSASKIQKIVLDALKKVGLDKSHMKMYP